VDDRTRLDPTFFSVPSSRWQDIDGDTFRDLTRINLAISMSLADWAAQGVASDVTDVAEVAVPATSLPPAQLALKLHEIAGKILAASAADEQDLRQVITTLRTALAVCWDLYSVRESETVTVAEHMNSLRLRIEDFERELVEIRRGKDRDEDLFRE